MNFRLFLVFIFLISCKILGQYPEWENLGTMPVPVYGGEAVATDSVIYILGGYSDSLGSATNLIQSYNPATNQWKTVGRMNESRVGFVALKFYDDIIVYGGLAEGDTISPVLEKITIKPDTILFKTDTTLKENRLYASGIIKDSSLIIIGGNPDINRNTPSDSNSYIFVYNLNGKSAPVNIDSTFADGTNIPYQQMCAVYGNVIYVFGGLYLGVSSWIYEFNFSTSEFGKKSIDLYEPRAGGRAVSGDNGKIYLIGGYNEISLANHTSLKSVEIFDTYTGKLRQGPQLNFPRKEFMAAQFGGFIYVFGGKGLNDSTIRNIERNYSYITTNTTAIRQIPKAFSLYDCYPNPFNPSTNIAFSVPIGSNITLDIYSLLGEKVTTLASGYFNAGTHKMTWDGKDRNGISVASGLYFYRLSDGKNSFTKKAVLLK